tara:strand:+ start:818 stop:1030 length:213 start_codon:yes stop_codon:yes gene_type:complete
MIIPIRCFSCNKVLSNKVDIWRKYVEEQKDPKKKQEKTPEEILNSLGLIRKCCRIAMISHYDSVHDTKTV